MTLLLLTILLIAAALAFGYRFVYLTHDLPRHAPESHFTDPDFLPPSARLG